MGARSGGGGARAGGGGSRSTSFAGSASSTMKAWLGAGKPVVAFTSSPKDWKQAAAFKAAGGKTNVFGKSMIKVDSLESLNKMSGSLKGMKITGFTLTTGTSTAKTPKYTSTGHRIGQKTFSPKSTLATGTIGSGEARSKNSSLFGLLLY